MTVLLVALGVVVVILAIRRGWPLLLALDLALGLVVGLLVGRHHRDHDCQ